MVVGTAEAVHDEQDDGDEQTQDEHDASPVPPALSCPVESGVEHQAREDGEEDVGGTAGQDAACREAGRDVARQEARQHVADDEGQTDGQPSTRENPEHGGGGVERDVHVSLLW